MSTALRAVQERISNTAHAASRPAESVHLLAVTKKVNAQRIRVAYAAGQRAFGESYVQEALAKQQQLADLAIEWHFIGPIQSNKTRPIAEHFDWVHSVDRLKIAERLNTARPRNLPVLNICIQVNIDDDTGKSGINPDRLPALAQAIRDLPRLRLRGLMTIPHPQTDPRLQRIPFRRLRLLRDRLKDENLVLDTLSMGMSDDFEAAIMEGSTLVRIGSALFGKRA
jgi:PLP dependent protein